MPEIMPGVHQIPVDYKGRPLKLYLLIGEAASLLMDSGDAEVPQKDLLPYFASIGFDPARLTYILITHPDTDHRGGVSAMKRACPQARIICGTADREQVEDPGVLIDVRYRARFITDGLGPDEAGKAKMLPRCGEKVVVDLTLEAGGELWLGERMRVRVLHLPGHSRGHLGVYLPRENAAFIGDAVQSTGNYFLDGRQAIAVTYYEVDESLGTIRQLEALGLSRLYSCHWRDCLSREEVAGWLAEAREYIQQAERVIEQTVRSAGPKGLTMLELIQRAKPGLGSWPAERDADARHMMAGHLRKLEGMGRVRALDEFPNRYAIT